MRGEEVWAQQVIARALGVEVHGHDDNSRPSMYDLRVGPPEAPAVAIEVVGAVDEQWTETWNVGPAVEGKRWKLNGDWMLTISRTAKVKRIEREGPALISSLEQLGVHHHQVNRWWHGDDDALDDALDSLGVESLYCMEPNGSGVIHMTMSGQGGGVHDDGNLVADWVVEFLTDDQRADVLHKLSLSNADRREVFIGVTFMGAPWSVSSYLDGILRQLPGASPLLPRGVDGVWLAPTSFFREGVGLRWDGAAWSHFHLRVGDDAPDD